MKRIITAFLVPVLAVVSMSSAAPKGVQPRIETLDNGMKLIFVERREQPVVAACVIYDVGSVNDPRGQSGIAHLFEHMLFKGSSIIGTTDFEAEKKLIAEQEELRIKMNDEMDRMRMMKRRGKIEDVLNPGQWTPEYTTMKKRFDELMEENRKFIKNNELFNLYTTNGGAGLNAGTSEDFTVYFVQLPANKIELFFWLESDRMQNGIMREFYVERDNVREERRLRTESTPTGKLDEAFEALFWQSHPYGIPVLGWASEVESITSQDVRDFYEIYYAPNNARLVMVGDFDSSQMLESARKYFGRIPKGKIKPAVIITEEPKPIAERRLIGEAETNPSVSVRFPGVAIGHPDEPALSVLAGLLSGKTGRLYKRLVTKEEAAMGTPGAGNSSRKYAGYFEVDATVKEGHTPEAVEQMLLEEVDKLREGEITDHELQKVKNQVLAGSIQRLRSNTGLMFQLAVYDTWYDWNYLNELPEQTMKVTADDVRRVAKAYCDPKTRTVAIYRTKAGTTKDEDPEFAAAMGKLPPEAQAQVKAGLGRLKQATDGAKIAASVQQMEAMLASGQVPEEQKPVLAVMVKAAKARMAELEGEKKDAGSNKEQK